MPDPLSRLYENVCRHARETALLNSIESVLGWDERTMLPAAGGEHRADQMTLLAGMVHQRLIEPQYGDSLGQLAESPLAADPHSDSGATIRRLKRQHDKKVKLPQSLVEELARTSVLGQQAWQEARQNDDFAAMRPWLEKTFALKRQEADALGYADRPYDALLDDYEPEERTSHVAEVLRRLREELVPLVEAIRGSARRPDTSILRRTYPTDAQKAFGRQAAEQIGFDFQRGRLDVTAHPFCAGLGPNDCRITTRYNERFFNESFFGILHEAGHGIYDQGLRTDQYGLPLGEAISLGIHESQSRLWENLVGRSWPFWESFYPLAQQHFPAALGDVDPDDFYFAVNDVRASLIRVEADEATYNLHILIRFELEQALLDGDLPVADLPAAWNGKYRDYLGIEPSSDAAGVLQDVHWSAGLVGYFPTYSLGNLHSAQIFAAADAELGSLAQSFSQGEFQPLRQWLNEKIHQQGQRYSADELVMRITGKPLSHEPLMAHLRAKLGPLYGIA
ncbi:MAG: carboxypeptidase M32 [Rhodopirellula sp.]|mgnify:CR=1 FL=1|nr:carboxypeptidase M32 [Rhodopirellula sp.]